MADSPSQILAKLQTARDLAMAQLTDVLTDPKPTYSIDGEAVSWTAHATMLRQQVEMLGLEAAKYEPGMQQTQMFT